MATSSQILAGRAAVALTVDDSAFKMGLKLASARLREWGMKVSAAMNRYSAAASASMGRWGASVSASMGRLGASVSTAMAVAGKAMRSWRASAGGNAGKLAEAFGGAGGSLRKAGTSAMLGAGAGALPLVGGLKAFASVESELAKLRAAANPTAEEFKRLQGYVEKVGSTPGIGQANLAAAMTELVKAGMPLKQAMDGAGLAAVKFAKVAEVEVADAAVTATDMSNVFGENVTTAMDILSQAADSSSVSLREVTLAMSMTSAVAGMTGKGLRETATAIGIMGMAGLKGSDAGTALKTFLLRIAAPAEDGAKAVEEFGLKFRDASGTVKPMTGIIAELQSKLGGLGKAAKDEALRRIFGTDAIRPAAILLDKGAKGWDEFTKRMADGLPVGSKWSILMDTMAGTFEKAKTVIVNAGVAIGKALAPSIRQAGVAFQAAGQLATYWLGQNESSIVTYGKVVIAVGAVGAVLWTLGSALKFVAFGFSGLQIAMNAFGGAMGLLRAASGILLGALGALLSPIGLVAAAVGGLIGYAAYASGAFQELAATAGSTWASIGETASQTLQGITDAIAAGDMAAAANVAWAGLKVIFRQGFNWLHAGWLDFSTFFRRVWSEAVFSIAKIGTTAWAGMQSAWVQVSAFFESVWQSTVGGIKTAWGSAQNWIGKGWIKAMRAIGVYDEETAKIAMAILDEEHAKAVSTGAAKQAQVEADKQRRLAAIGKEEAASLVSLESMRQGEQDRISATHAAALKADKEELSNAKKALDVLTVKAQKAANQKLLDDKKKEDEQREQRTKKDIAAAQEAGKSADKGKKKGGSDVVVGTFSAQLAAMLIGGKAGKGTQRAVTRATASRERSIPPTTYGPAATKFQSFNSRFQNVWKRDELAKAENRRRVNEGFAKLPGMKSGLAGALDAAVAVGQPRGGGASAPAAALSRAAVSAPAAMSSAMSGGRDSTSQGILAATNRSADLLFQILNTLQTGSASRPRYQ